MNVRLTDFEYQIAIQVAARRRLDSAQRAARDANGALLTPWDADAIGALGEAATAKALGLWWSGGWTCSPDLAGGLEVRATTRPGGRLIIKQTDKDEPPYILAIGEARNPLAWRLAGWIYGHEAKLERWWADPTRRSRWAWFVPQDQLRPMDTLPIVEAMR